MIIKITTVNFKAKYEKLTNIYKFVKVKMRKKNWKKKKYVRQDFN